MKHLFIKRVLFILLKSCLFLFLTGVAYAEVSLPDLVKKIEPAVVTIVNYSSRDRVSGLATGFFVNREGHLITNYHVFKDVYKAEVRTSDGKRYPISSALAENREVDLIKVKVDIPESAVHWVEISDQLPVAAEKIMVLGSPMGLEKTVTEGIVSALRSTHKKEDLFQISAPISKGSSGSPVINMRGEVIGVATFQIVNGQNLNFAVPGKYVIGLSPESRRSNKLFKYRKKMLKIEKDKKGSITISNY